MSIHCQNNNGVCCLQNTHFQKHCREKLVHYSCNGPNFFCAWSVILQVILLLEKTAYWEVLYYLFNF